MSTLSEARAAYRRLRNEPEFYRNHMRRMITGETINLDYDKMDSYKRELQGLGNDANSYAARLNRYINREKDSSDRRTARELQQDLKALNSEFSTIIRTINQTEQLFRENERTITKRAPSMVALPRAPSFQRFPFGGNLPKNLTMSQLLEKTRTAAQQKIITIAEGEGFVFALGPPPAGMSAEQYFLDQLTALPFSEQMRLVRGITNQEDQKTLVTFLFTADAIKNLSAVQQATLFRELLKDIRLYATVINRFDLPNLPDYLKEPYLIAAYGQISQMDLDNLTASDQEIMNAVAAITGYDTTITLRNLKEFNRAFSAVDLVHSAEIFKMACLLPEREKNIFWGYLDELQINQLPAGEKASFDGTFIKINFDNNSVKNGNPKYLTFFHEYGHFIDRQGSTNNDSMLTVSPLKEEVFEAVVSDVKNRMRQVGQAYATAQGYDIALVEQAVQNIREGNNRLDPPLASPTNLEQIELEIQETIRKELAGESMGQVSDLYGGATNNVLSGGSEHPVTYWRNTDGTEKVSTLMWETGAHGYAAFALSPAKLRELEEYLPSVVPYVDDALNSTEQKAKERLGL